VVGGLTLFHAINNWIWLKANVTLLGWDVPSHLGTSFVVNGILHPLGPQTLFEAFIWHPNRPPLVFLLTVPLYRLFGVSSDVGTMVNVLFLAVLFGAVYATGALAGGRRAGLLSVFVVATLPMIFAISRYYYIELPLAAVVTLSVYALLASRGFERRWPSLWFGVCLGLGLLTKRTYPVFLFAPLLLVIIRSQALRALVGRLRGGLHIDLREMVAALGVGLALALAWFLPAREIASRLPLGFWLVPLWALLIAGTIWLLRRTPGPDTNLLSALSLGATIGSLWYLPRITFIDRLLRFGYGVNDPWDRSANLDQLATYLHFPLRLIGEHVSPLYTLLLVVVVGGLLIYLLRRGQVWTRLRHAEDFWWVVALWTLGTYLVFTFSLYRKSRGIVPVLPALALVLAVGLLKLPWKRLVTLVVLLIIAWGLLQFFVLSYEGPHRLAERTTFSLPVLGEGGLFAQGGSIQLARKGDTDPGYWAVSDILEIVDAERHLTSGGTAKLGVMVNNKHANPDLFGLLIVQGYPGIQSANLARSSSDTVYRQLFEQDYLVLIERNYQWIDDAAQEALRHLEETPAFFDATFELARRFPWPDGDAVLLYRKTQRLAPGYATEDYDSLAQSLAALEGAEGAILLVPPEQVEALGRAYRGTLIPYPLPTELPLDPEATAAALEKIAAQYPILSAVFRQEEGVDPERFVERWLTERAYRWLSGWHGGVRLVIYGAAGEADLAARRQSAGVTLGESIELAGWSLAEEAVLPGEMIRLALFWQAMGPIGERYTGFVHLVDSNGRLVSQQDSEPLAGFRPTESWEQGEVIRDPVGLLVPAGTPAGMYRLLVGFYHPETGERLPVLDAGGHPLGDVVPLGTIQVGAEPDA
jgi:4-amino-4-deoxy-L-arabinose transferase-like glycosyltransferase